MAAIILNIQLRVEVDAESWESNYGDTDPEVIGNLVAGDVESAVQYHFRTTGVDAKVALR